MALKKLVERITRPVDEQDRSELSQYCDGLAVTHLDEVVARTSTRVAGEVRSVRIVPRAGADALEVTFGDGRGLATAVFLGRRKIAGMSPGRRLVLEGVAARDGKQLLLYNPIYTFLPPKAHSRR